MQTESPESMTPEVPPNSYEDSFEGSVEANIEAQTWVEPCPYINFALVIADGVKFTEDERLNFLLAHYQTCPQCLDELNRLKADLGKIERMIPFASSVQEDEKHFLARLEQFHRPGVQWERVQLTVEQVVRDLGLAIIRPRFLFLAFMVAGLWLLFYKYGV